MRDTSSDELTTVEDEDGLVLLLRALTQHPWLRALHLVSSLRVDDEGDTRGYHARAIFQSDDMASRPLEVQLQGIRELSIAEGGHIRATGTGRLTEDGVEIDLDHATLVCEAVRYRVMPRESTGPGAGGSVAVH